MAWYLLCLCHLPRIPPVFLLSSPCHPVCVYVALTGPQFRSVCRSVGRYGLENVALYKSIHYIYNILYTIHTIQRHHGCTHIPLFPACGMGHWFGWLNDAIYGYKRYTIGIQQPQPQHNNLVLTLCLCVGVYMYCWYICYALCMGKWENSNVLCWAALFVSKLPKRWGLILSGQKR